MSHSAAPTPAPIEWSDPQRQAAFAVWLAAQAAAHGVQPATVRAASADASFRRYFRVDRDAAQGGGSLVVMDAPVPGIAPWNDIVRSPLLWHFDFGGPDMERLVAGRERIYLDRFWNEFAGNPKKVDEATRQHYAGLYARPGAMHAAFAQFRAIRQDAVDNEASSKNKLTMPVLAVGGEKSFGNNEAIVMRNAADNVTEVVIAGAGHWLMEEAPTETAGAIRSFLAH